MNSLFICATQFQILSAVSIVASAPEKFGKADIFLISSHAEDTRWHKTLKDTKLFEHIYCLPLRHNFSLKALVKSVIHGDPYGFFGGYSAAQLLLFFLFKKRYVNKLVKELNQDAQLKGCQFPAKQYDKLFFGSTERIGERIIQSITHTGIEMYGMDEGLGSYFYNLQQNYPQLKSMYLFEPECAVDDFPTERIAKLDEPHLSFFWELINKHFGKDLKSIQKGVYFFDQFLFMPSNLKPCIENWEHNPYIERKDQILRDLRNLTTRLGGGYFA